MPTPPPAPTPTVAHSHACAHAHAGAVEQLKTHCSRLHIPLYERGYEKDPAKV